MKSSLSNFNSYLSDIETELKQLQEKHSSKPEYNEEDINRLLDILEKLNEKILDLDIEDNLDKKVVHY
jgi:flagellar hook-associated protein FlgK